MDRKSPLKLVELMSCAITLGAPIVASGIVSADNVNEVQNVSYQNQNTKIAFDPNDALTKQALSKTHQSGAIKSVALIILKDGKTSSVNMNNENGVYVAILQGNQKGTKYQFAITYQDGKTVKINNPYADNKLDTQFSVIGSKGVNPSVKTTNVTTVAPNGQMLEMEGTTSDGNSQTVTINFHLYYLNKDTKTKVGDAVISLQIPKQFYSRLTSKNTGQVNANMVENYLAKSTVAAHCPNGYELIDPFSNGNSDKENANKIIPINVLTTVAQMETNNTIECDYEVAPVSAQSSSSSSSSSAQTSSTTSSSNSSSSPASVSVVSSSKVSVSSSSVAATPSKSSSSASDTQNHNQPAVVEKSTAISVSSNSDSKSSNSNPNKKQSESSVSSSSTNAKSENNDSQNEQHNTAAVTQGATNSGGTAENDGKGNGSFLGKSNGTTGEKQQAAVTKKADNGNNGGNAENAGATNDNNGNTNSNSASDSSSSSSSSSSVSSSSSSVAGNDNEKSMPQTGEMILRGLGILGVAVLACVGGYYGFQAYKKKTNK